jgi:hypothetical protein
VVNEIVIVWQWTDGTRCVLSDVGSDQLELQVIRDGHTLRREPVTDVASALAGRAPQLEVEVLTERTQQVPDVSVGQPG